MRSDQPHGNRKPEKDEDKSVVLVSYKIFSQKKEEL